MTNAAASELKQPQGKIESPVWSDSPSAVSSAVSYEVLDWLAQFERSRSGLLRQFGYALARPLLSLEARRRLTEETLTATTPSLVLRERGFPVEARRRWALTQVDVKNATILVQGTGSGWDVLTWASFRPQRIIATDLYEFAGWKDIARYCAKRWNVECEFRQAPLENHSFLADASVDVCVSDAVFEHCRDLAAVVAESYRMLKPGGRVYASYGPLWFCGGGDHYSGRGGLEHLYNHVLLSSSDYRRYADSYRLEAEGFQEGYRYVELDLFSRLTTIEYLTLFRQEGFAIDEVVLEISSDALRFRGKFPQRFSQLLAHTSHRCSVDDLLIKTNIVRLTKQ
jgi:SAM-dependent methyltransferase